MPVVSVDKLSYTYPGASVPALSGISLEIDHGDYLAIVGANGSGKSTLVRCLNGLLLPPPGTVSVAGGDPSDAAGRSIARRAYSLVFQSPTDQIVASVAEEDVAFGLENLGVPRAEMRDRVEQALRAVGLLDDRRRSPRFLSAGQQQRLAVAGAIAMRPRVVAFDEATSMIDPVGRRDVLDLMDGLASEGVAVVHVTHDMDEAARARRVAVMSGGRIVFLGAPAELFASDGLAGLRLARPRSWTAALALGLDPVIGEDAEALGRRAARAGLGLERIAGAAPLAPKAVPAGSEAFRLESASMSYLAGTESEKLAVNAVTLSIPVGTRLALVGKTGSGKSSLLQLLDGLAMPDSGLALSFGVDTADKKADLRAVRMRSPLAVQRPESAFFELYAGDEVAFGPRNQGIRGQALVDRVRLAMDSAGLPFGEYRDARTRSLSGGRKRRLALASILSLDPEALLLDEPTAALDPASRVEVGGLIEEFAGRGPRDDGSAATAAGGVSDAPGASRGRVRTVVISTHSMDEAAAADLVAVMDSGSLVAFGPPDAVFGSGWDPAWGIGRPFAYELVSSAARTLADTASEPGVLS